MPVICERSLVGEHGCQVTEKTVLIGCIAITVLSVQKVDVC